MNHFVCLNILVKTKSNLINLTLGGITNLSNCLQFFIINNKTREVKISLKRPKLKFTKTELKVVLKNRQTFNYKHAFGESRKLPITEEEINYLFRIDRFDAFNNDKK